MTAKTNFCNIKDISKILTTAEASEDSFSKFTLGMIPYSNQVTINTMLHAQDKIESCIHTNFGDKYNDNLGECHNLAQEGNLLSYINCLGQLEDQVNY
ncbi:MAG: hypothetical protein WBJ81_01215 [Rickettsiales bacterium]